MVASVFVVARRIDGWGLTAFVAVGLGLAAGYGIAVAVPAQTGPELYKFALSGAVASVAMILPGISGSFLLVVMGKYQQILGAVNERDLAIIAFFGGGFAVGILGFSRVLRWLLAHAHGVTMAFLVGLMAGSIRKVWPFRQVLGVPALTSSTASETQRSASFRACEKRRTRRTRMNTSPASAV